MKSVLLFFLLGAAAGAIGMGLYSQRHPPQPTSLGGQAQQAAAQAADKTKSAAGNLRDSFAAKLEEWHLTPEEIKADLVKSGQVVRNKTSAVGSAISDARILSVIKAKFVLDRDLSALAINVDVTAGEVVLQGNVPSADLIGKAIALTLDTDGVRNVTAKLAVMGD
ncbi:MAG: BON domain-containing protein [Opitutaceae bacterium]|nr:BON domain-containing protein [Opitutaceae bacterium]